MSEEKISVKYLWLAFGILLGLLTAILLFWMDKKSNRTAPISQLATIDSVALPAIPEFVPFASYETPAALDYPIGKPWSQNAGEGSIGDKFYPIGWSRDGKFAYLLEPLVGERDGHYLEFYIQDMESDKTLWKWTNMDDAIENLGFERTWRKERHLFTKKLNDYRIYPIKHDRLSSIPISESGITHSFHLDNTYTSTDESLRLAGVRVIRRTNGGNKKILHSRVYTDEYGKSDVISNAIVGCLRSPFEPRVALLYTRTILGWHGGADEVSFTLIGSQLPSNY